MIIGNRGGYAGSYCSVHTNTNTLSGSREAGIPLTLSRASLHKRILVHALGASNYINCLCKLTSARRQIQEIVQRLLNSLNHLLLNRLPFCCELSCIAADGNPFWTVNSVYIANDCL